MCVYFVCGAEFGARGSLGVLWMDGWMDGTRVGARRSWLFHSLFFSLSNHMAAPPLVLQSLALTDSGRPVLLAGEVERLLQDQVCVWEGGLLRSCARK